MSLAVRNSSTSTSLASSTCTLHTAPLRLVATLFTRPLNPIVLIVDNLRIHHARIVRAWPRRRKLLIRVFYLPSYSPELNADELVNADLKIGIGKREPAVTKAELEQQMCEHKEANQSNPEKMKRLFLKDSVRYAAE